MKKLSVWLRNLKHRFFDGPRLFHYPGRTLKGYKSVNLMVAYWLRALVILHFTLPGRVLFLLMGYVLLTSMLTLLMPLYFLAFTLVALFITNIAIGWYFRPKLEIKRTIPELVPAHSSIPLHYRIRNLRKRVCWDLVVDSVPMGPALTFLDSPGFIKELDGGESVYLSNRLTAKRRGKYVIPHPVAGSAFPFGLFRWSSVGIGNTPLKVYPNYSILKEFNLFDGNFGQNAESEFAHYHGGNSMDFHGIREFKDGDNPRFIHAPSWARLGIPVIKEFRDDGMHQVALFVEISMKIKGSRLRNLVQRKENPALEAILTLTASCTEYLVRHRYHLEVFIQSAKEICHLETMKSGQLETVLELLADIEDASSSKIDNFSPEILHKIADFSSVVLLFLEWNQENARFVNELEKQGARMKVIVIGKTKDDEVLPPDHVTVISSAKILAGKVEKL